MKSNNNKKNTNELGEVEIKFVKLEEQRKLNLNAKTNLNDISSFFKNFKNNLSHFNNHLQKEAVRSVIKNNPF